jgi:hypothetical protein
MDKIVSNPGINKLGALIGALRTYGSNKIVILHPRFSGFLRVVRSLPMVIIPKHVEGWIIKGTIQGIIPPG